MISTVFLIKYKNISVTFHPRNFIIKGDEVVGI
jgi:hypothetical protein